MNSSRLISNDGYLWDKCISPHEFDQVYHECKIHPSAVIAEGARIGRGTIVGPFSVIGGDVRIGCNNRIGSSVVLEGRTTIGDGNQIYSFAAVGSAPQDLKYDWEDSEVLIGDRNIVRENVTIQPGTAGGLMKTIIGDDNLFMTCSHVAHDVKIGNGNVVANSAAIAGHVEIGDKVIIGGLVGLHQFTRIGSYVMIGGGSMVAKDIPPFLLVTGDRARVVSINLIGVQRAGFSETTIKNLKNAFSILFHDAELFEKRIARVRVEYRDVREIEEMVDFIEKSKRGIVSC